VPSYLRPTAPIAGNAILVGDPGRALLLAQELLGQPKMSNHARGLWGYSGRTHAGEPLTIQSTGIGGPSAALVLGDLAELGVRRAIRVGTCAATERATLGELLVVREAIAEGGSAAAHGAVTGKTVLPDPVLTELLGQALGGHGRVASVASFDTHPGEGAIRGEALAADMQTAPLLARARELGIAAAAVLIVVEQGRGASLEKGELEACERSAGRAASAVLSS
jgi:uridine phosphorylase